MTRSTNLDLRPLPDDDAIIDAVHGIVAARSDADRRYRVLLGASANEVALQLGVQPADRLGNGAVRGSWSGRMSPALRVAPRLRRLAREGRLAERYDRATYKNRYEPTEEAP
jgi:hypothetical protein